MRIGYFALLNNPVADPAYVDVVGRTVEDCGFHSLWVGEHVVLFDDYTSRYPYSDDGSLALPRDAGLLEPLTTLAFLAACTRRIRLGTGIYILPEHNPVQAAKEIANVDWLSGGRLDLGLGIGWSREEFAALAAPWPRRGARTEEYLGLMQELWTEEVSSFAGEFYELAPCRMHPKPVQQPRPPVYFGGNSEAALRRIARTGDGWLALSVGPDEVREGVRRLATWLSETGREPSEVEVAVFPGLESLDRDLLERYRDAGATQVVTSSPGSTPEEARAGIEKLAEALGVGRG